ncbi:scrFIAM, partial [Symbiodinium sp. KB8]
DDVPRAGLIRSTRSTFGAGSELKAEAMQNPGLPFSSQADGRWGTGPEQAWEAQGPLPLHVLPPVGSLDHPKANASLGSGGRPGPSENLLEQFHIGATLTGSAQADYRSTMEQFGNWETPMHVPQSFPLQVGAAPVPNCPPSSESVMWIDKRQNADVQAEHQRIFGEMAQNLKQQGFHGEYYQQVVTEIAKQLPGVDASLERGYTGPMLPPVAPPPVVPPVVPPVAASPVAPLAPPKNLDGVAPGGRSAWRFMGSFLVEVISRATRVI